MEAEGKYVLLRETMEVCHTCDITYFECVRYNVAFRKGKALDIDIVNLQMRASNFCLV
jgi:hypothetical protein